MQRIVSQHQMGMYALGINVQVVLVLALWI